MRAIVVRSIVGPGSLVASGALPELRWVLHFARGVWAQSAAGLAFNTLDKFLVGVVGGAAILGGYGALVQLTSLIHFVPASVATVHTPRLIQTARDDESSVRFESLLQRLSREINLIVIALSVTVSVLGFFVWRFSLWPLLPLSEYWWTAVLIYVAYIVLAKAISCHSQLIAYGMTSSIGRVTLIAAALSSMTLCIGWMIESVLLLAVSRLVFSMAILIGWHQATKVRSLS
jgi:O-antigen/teichoic acid export membrane protein